MLRQWLRTLLWSPCWRSRLSKHAVVPDAYSTEKMSQVLPRQFSFAFDASKFPYIVAMAATVPFFNAGMWQFGSTSVGVDTRPGLAGHQWTTLPKFSRIAQRFVSSNEEICSLALVQPRSGGALAVTPSAECISLSGWTTRCTGRSEYGRALCKLCACQRYA